MGDEGAGAWKRVAGASRDSKDRLGQAELRDVIDAVQEAVVIFDTDGKVLSMNPTALRLHGCTTLEDCRMSYEQFLERFQMMTADGRLLRRDERPLARSLRGEVVSELELTVREVRTGRTWIGQYSAVPFVSAGGRRLVTETIRDVTDLKHAIEALRESDRRKDELLAMLSHELRNPLAPIRSAVYLLDRADPGSDGARRARETIARQVSHLVRVVDDLLDVSRLARGRIELRRTRVDLAEIVRRAADDHAALLAEGGVELDLSVPAGPVPLNGDATRLAQVLGCLLQNAAKFTERGGRVGFSLSVAGGSAEIRVRDTGSGIDRELVGQVFEPFVQAERTLARTRGGLGLGLALVKGLVELHGGSVSARSEGTGAGAEFTVALPMSSEATVDAAAAEGPAAAGARRVLVVDDNVDAAASLSDLVAHFGHTVDVVHDGAAAVARVREVHPDVVLCDIGLPGMDGYEVARTVRADSGLSDVRLVAVSGYAQAEDRERAARAGFDAHVAKPADPALIARLLA
jgi:PAS domain S-box-containing protein